MLGVFINLLYTYTMPNNHYCSTYMMPYPHLLAKHCLRVGRKSRSEARNLPTCGCKSMMDGLTIMLRVFINLLYTHTMPNNHYCSTYMMPYPHLMAKHCLRVGRNIVILTQNESVPTDVCQMRITIDCKQSVLSNNSDGLYGISLDLSAITHRPTTVVCY